MFQPNGKQGNGGFIRIQAGNNLLHSGLIEANGLLSGGVIALTAGDDVAGVNQYGGLDCAYSRSQIPAFLIPGPLTPPASKVTTGRYFDEQETLFNFGGIRALGGERNGKVYLAGNNQILLYEGSFLNNVRMNVRDIVGSTNPNQAFQNSLSGLNAKEGHVYAVTGQRITAWLGDIRTAASTVLEAVREGTEPDVNPQVRYQGSELPDDFFFEPAPSQP